MVLNTKILNYYLDSETYFHSHLMYFFDLFGHISCCIDNKGNRHEFASAVAVKTLAREKADEGFIFFDEPSWLQEYFSKEYSDEQLFAIVFGAWYGLSESACRMIADRSRPTFAWKILNGFLCGMTSEKMKAILIDKSRTTARKKQLLDMVEYDGDCEIYVDGGKIQAIKNGETLTTQSGIIYKQIYE